MKSMRIFFCTGFLFLFYCVSEAKNKADSGLLAKKDKIQNHISQKLVENQLMFEWNYRKTLHLNVEDLFDDIVLN
jgi:hypothetical protein